MENLNNIFKLIIEDGIFNLKAYVLTPHPGTMLEKDPDQFGIKIHHRKWDEYLEWGGFPAYSTKYLTASQIYSYWLLAQMVIREAQLISRKLKDKNEVITVKNSLPETFGKIFDKIG